MCFGLFFIHSLSLSVRRLSVCFCLFDRLSINLSTGCLSIYFCLFLFLGFSLSLFLRQQDALIRLHIGYQYSIQFEQKAVLEAKPISDHQCKLCKTPKSHNLSHYLFCYTKTLQRRALISLCKFYCRHWSSFGISEYKTFFYRQNYMRIKNVQWNVQLNI